MIMFLWWFWFLIILQASPLPASAACSFVFLLLINSFLWLTCVSICFGVQTKSPPNGSNAVTLQSILSLIHSEFKYGVNLPAILHQLCALRRLSPLRAGCDPSLTPAAAWDPALAFKGGKLLSAGCSGDTRRLSCSRSRAQQIILGLSQPLSGEQRLGRTQPGWSWWHMLHALTRAPVTLKVWSLWLLDAEISNKFTKKAKQMFPDNIFNTALETCFVVQTLGALV